MNLWQDTQAQQLTLREGELWLFEHVLPDADEVEQALHKTLNWQSGTVRFGQIERTIPRLQAWYGDPDAFYAYSGLKLTPQPWTSRLTDLRTRAESLAGHTFNSVLCNLYRDGRDSVAWHADNEAPLGRNPVIASLSLGATRTFHLKHRQTGERLKLPLHHNTLLVMKGALQHHWVHAVLKEPGIQAPRINLTFRKVNPPRS
ncbi:MAG: alpha-ketoglutarate-dependent dioxygenase AlkB [Gammaproteobacteria bacterium]|nr:MAG: alpha-ketoglutarate-dependent dioxygenase AlkB [Gammaproteobacteria bacterium]